MDTKDAYRQKREAQLKEWGAQINLLEAKAENIGADMKIKHAEIMRDLRAKHHAASEEVKNLSKASEEAWEQVKSTADRIWDDLKHGVSEAHSKFK
jgi:hypothetical protein